jgi:NADP-dependent 3-hydroxy acid dehydrogenase YdfG
LSTGGDSKVAQALATDLLKVGWHVILIARGQQALEKVQTLVFMKMFRLTDA